MKGLVLACAAAAASIPAFAAEAQHVVQHGACEQWRHGQCLSWRGISRPQASADAHDVGYDFGPRHAFLDLGALPHIVVTRYHLGPDFRYVNENGRVYVVNPHTYRVVRVITLR